MNERAFQGKLGMALTESLVNFGSLVVLVVALGDNVYLFGPHTRLVSTF